MRRYASQSSYKPQSLIAACRRARQPGCKFDNITVLEGPEGINKSTAIRVIAGDDNFSDQSLLGARDKEVQEQLCGIWMHENADLAGMRRADVEHVKAFASRQKDRARPAYGRVVENKKRRSIEWGSTNNWEYLQSQVGNRRFWPLLVKKIDVEALKRDRLQLLGEAAHYEAQDESLLLDSTLWPDAEKEQEKRRSKHPWEEILGDIPDRIILSPVAEGKEPPTIQIIYRELGLELVRSSDVLTVANTRGAAKFGSQPTTGIRDGPCRLGEKPEQNHHQRQAGARLLPEGTLLKKFPNNQRTKPDPLLRTLFPAGFSLSSKSASYVSRKISLVTLVNLVIWLGELDNQSSQFTFLVWLGLVSPPYHQGFLTRTGLAKEKTKGDFPPCWDSPVIPVDSPRSPCHKMSGQP